MAFPVLPCSALSCPALPSCLAEEGRGASCWQHLHPDSTSLTGVQMCSMCHVGFATCAVNLMVICQPSIRCQAQSALCASGPRCAAMPAAPHLCNKPLVISGVRDAIQGRREKTIHAESNKVCRCFKNVLSAAAFGLQLSATPGCRAWPMF